MGSPISRKARALRVRKRREKKGILAEGVSLEVVHAHRDEIKLRVGVVVEEAERHDADARFEGEEIGLVVRASFREDRDALLLGQGIPHRSEHLMIVDMREELERERGLIDGVRVLWRKTRWIRRKEATRASISRDSEAGPCR